MSRRRASSSAGSSTAASSSRSPARCPSTASPTPSTSPPSTAAGTWRPASRGDTVYAWSEVLETAEIPGRGDVGALRVRLTAVKNRSCADFPLRNAKGEYADGVILDLDLWLVLPLT